MARLPDWPQRFRAELARQAQTPFDWETDNCALRAADMAQAITGRDWAPEFRGKSKADQVKLLRKAGGLAALLADKCGEAIPPAQARRADVAIVQTQTGRAAGIIDPPHIWAAGPAGNVRLNLEDAIAAFKVD